MTTQQSEAVEKSISGLSPLDKLELVERLLSELRSSVASGERPLADRVSSISEAEFKQQLLDSGLMLGLPIPPGSAPRPEWQPIAIEGEPLSETIIRERR